MKTRILITLTALLIGVAASAKDLRTVVFYVKDMHCENCEKKVKENIRFEKGLKSLSTDVDSRTVTITYDADKTSVEELQAGFAKFNYTAELVSDQSNTEINAAKTGSSSSSGKTTTTDSKAATTAGSKSTSKSTTDAKSATQTTTSTATSTTQKVTGDQPIEVEPQADEGQQPPIEGSEPDEPSQSTATQAGKTTQSTQATQSTQTSKTTQSSQSTQKK